MSLARRIFRERRRVAVPLLAFLAVNVGVLILVVLPLRQAVASAEEGERDATMRLNQARVQEKAAQDLSGRTDQAEKDLREFHADVLPQDLASARSLVTYWTLRAATANNLQLRSGEFGQERVDDKDSRLMRHSGRIVLSGQYLNIRRFLYSLETAEEFIIVENVALEQASQMGVAGQDAGIMVALVLATYYPGEAR